MIRALLIFSLIFMPIQKIAGPTKAAGPIILSGSAWAIINYCDNVGAKIGTCSLGTCTTSTCTLNVAAIAAGDSQFYFMGSSVNSNTIASVTVSGETLNTHCPAGYAGNQASNGSTDCFYLLSANGGASSVVIVPTTTGGGGNVYGVVEVRPLSGHAASVDGTPVNTTSAGCTTCTPASFTPSARSIIFQQIGTPETPTAIAAPYLFPGVAQGSVLAIGANTTGAQTPVWTQTPSGLALMSTFGFKN